VLDAVLARYRATYTSATPVINPKFAESALQNRRQAAWSAASRTVEAYLLDGKVTVTNQGQRAVDVPLTMPAGTKYITASLLGVEVAGSAFGDAYGGERSEWRSVGQGAQQLLRVS
jgi:hypothetical protein